MTKDWFFNLYMIVSWSDVSTAQTFFSLRIFSKDTQLHLPANYLITDCLFKFLWNLHYSAQRKPGKSVHLRNVNCRHIQVACVISLPKNCVQLFLITLFSHRWSARCVTIVINHPKWLFNALPVCGYRATSEYSPRINEAFCVVCPVTHPGLCFIIGRPSHTTNTRTTDEWQHCCLCLWQCLMSV